MPRPWIRAKEERKRKKKRKRERNGEKRGKERTRIGGNGLHLCNRNYDQSRLSLKKRKKKKRERNGIEGSPAYSVFKLPALDRKDVKILR